LKISPITEKSNLIMF